MDSDGSRLRENLERGYTSPPFSLPVIQEMCIMKGVHGRCIRG